MHLHGSQAQEKLPVKADLAIYINMLGVPGQYKSVYSFNVNWISVVAPIRTVFAEPDSHRY